MINCLEATKIVNKLFPHENFFTFKYSLKLSERNLMNKEQDEIKRINEQAIEHGNYIFKNHDQAFFMPILNANDSRDLIIKSIFEMISYCEC